MKRLNRKSILLSAVVLAAVVVGLLLWSPDAGEPAPAPQVVQDSITLSSPQGPVAMWGGSLVRPLESDITVYSDSPFGYLLQYIAETVVIV